MNYSKSFRTISKIELDRDFRESIKGQMADDFGLLIRTLGKTEDDVKYFAKIFDIHERTLKRVLLKASAPQVDTIKKFYSYFFRLFKRMQPIHDKLFDVLHIDYDEVARVRTMEDYDSLLCNNPVFRNIYMFTRTGEISKKFIMDRFGLYGVEILEKMKQDGFLVETSKGVFKEGPYNFAKSSEAVRKMIKTLLEDHIIPDQKGLSQKDRWLIAFLEGISEEAYQKIFKVSIEFRKYIADILKNDQEISSDQKTKRMFLFLGVDYFKI